MGYALSIIYACSYVCPFKCSLAWLLCILVVIGKGRCTEMHTIYTSDALSNQ